MDEYLSKKITHLRTTLIILVVFNHAGTSDGYFSGAVNDSFSRLFNIYLQAFIGDGLARVAVPLFFSISGYLFFRDFETSTTFYVRKIKSRTRTLLVPYLLFSFICLVFYYVMHSIPYTAKMFQAEKLLTEYGWLEFSNKLFINPIPGQLWFIRDLYIFVLLSPLFYWLLSRIRGGLLLGLFCIWFFAGDKSIAGDTLFAKNMEGVLFFAIGGFLSLNKIDIKFCAKKPFYIFVVWIILLSTKTYYSVVYHSRFIELHRLTVFVGLLAVWFNYDSLKALFGRQLYALAPYAFAIFLFHRLMLQPMRRAVRQIANGSEMGLLAGFFACVVLAVLLSVCMAFILRNLMPRVYAVIMGNRLAAK